MTLDPSEARAALQNAIKSTGRSSRRRTTMVGGPTYNVHTPLDNHFLPRATTVDDLTSVSVGNSTFGVSRAGSHIASNNAAHFDRDISSSSAGLYLPSSGRNAAAYGNSVQQMTGTSRKDAPCPHCRAYFKRKYDLLQHISAVHEKNRPFRCDICDTSFAHKGTLSKHIRTVHRRERPYACEHCGQRFSERGNVNKHKQRSNKCRMADLASGGRISSSQRPTSGSQFAPRQLPPQWYLNSKKMSLI